MPHEDSGGSERTNEIDSRRARRPVQEAIAAKAEMADGCTKFRKFLIEGTKPNLKKIREYVQRSAWSETLNPARS